MTPEAGNDENWKKVQELFHAACAEPAGKRADFLLRAAPEDPQLRFEVESLLKAHEDGDVLLDGTPLSSMVGVHPALKPGDKLGSFEIIGLLGLGGMGEVFRARDMRLRRDVAIKTLPPVFADNRDRVARFEREARAASALNHPNIVSVHDIGRENGVSFIVSELVDGKTVASVLERGPLPLRKVINIGTQVAAGLAAAHAAGVVHRDLKPGNVMLTNDGRVKILDFGLARLDRVPDPGSSTAEMSDPGFIVGTPGYMSPEQVRGEPTDARSDVFSFGVMLYEMASGKRAFQGGSSVEVMNSILKDDPPELPATSPPALDRVVRRCLEKSPGRRFQSAADLGFALESLSTAAAPSVAPKGRSRKKATIAVLAGGCLLLAASAVWWLPRPGTTAESNQLTSVPLTATNAGESSPSFSPDGNQVAYSSCATLYPDNNPHIDDKWHIYVKPIGPGKPLQLTADARNDDLPAWSPDGRTIAFARFKDRWGAAASIYAIPSLGGAGRKITEGFLWTQFSWSPDGRFLATSEYSPAPLNLTTLYLVDVENGNKLRLTTPPDEKTQDLGPTFSPDGRSLLFARCGGLNRCGLYLLELGVSYKPVGEPRLLMDGGAIAGVAWTADGKAVVYSVSDDGILTHHLMRLRLDKGAVPQRITLPGDEQNANPAIARHGNRLAYTRGLHDVDIWQLQRGKLPRSFVSSTRDDDNPQYSPDGRRVAFSSDRSGLEQIWICDRAGENQVQLTSFETGASGSPRWSPDGNWIAFDRQMKDGYRIFVMASDGGQMRRLTTGNARRDENIPSWSRDGKWIYYGSNRTGRNEVWKAPALGGDGTQVTRNGGWIAFESRNGRSLYYTKIDGTSDLWVRPLEGGEERLLVKSILCGFEVTEEGIYYSVQGKRRGLWSLQFHSFATGKDVEIAPIERSPINGMSVSPDQKTILFDVNVRLASNVMIVDNFR